MPEQKKVKKDIAYSHEQIHSLLDIADDRFRAIILLMTSTGMRVGAIPQLKIRNIEKFDDNNNDIYKVTIYENSKEEYVTFTTPECSKAIHNYLSMRQRYGEELTPESPLIREQFDVNDPFAISKASMINIQTIQRILARMSERVGIRKPEKLNVDGNNGNNNNKRSASCRKDIALCHGFRKFFSSQLIEADLKTELRWLLEGHGLKGNDSHYVRISEKRLQEEYLKAVNNLTINEENRLRRKVQTLEMERSQLESLAIDVEQIKRKIFS